MKHVVELSLAAVLVACVDFGYRVPAPKETDASVGGADAGTSDAGGSCVEGPVPPTTDGPQVSLITLNVDKPVLAINVGDVVTWRNTDSMVHTVTAGAPGAIVPDNAGGFDSGELAPGGEWAYRFCNRRTVIYFCKTHPQQMNGYRVIVGE